MRNEGAFLVEWICWYRMLGFDILIVVNDCTDHSPQLLEAFRQADWIRWTQHHPRKSQSPKRSAYNKIRNHRLVRETDWLLICDADEFLVLHQFDSISQFINAMHRQPMGMAFHWKAFGTDNNAYWHDGLIHRNFHAAAATRSQQNTLFKSMFRCPLDFRQFTDHAPNKTKSSPAKFANPGRPQPAIIAITNAVPINGILCIRPPSLRMSSVPVC